MVDPQKWGLSMSRTREISVSVGSYVSITDSDEILYTLPDGRVIGV